MRLIFTLPFPPLCTYPFSTFLAPHKWKLNQQPREHSLAIDAPTAAYIIYNGTDR